jgi:hypothetical protein
VQVLPRGSPPPRFSSSLASSPSWRRQRYSRRAPDPRSPCVMAHSPSALFGVKCPSCPKQACAKGASHVRHPDPPRPRRLREISESTQRAPTWVLTSGACARLLDRGASCSWQRVSGQTPPSKSPSTHGDVLRGPRCRPNKDNRSMEDLMQALTDQPSGGHRVNDHRLLSPCRDTHIAHRGQYRLLRPMLYFCHTG